jgi:hypothetical protein
LLSETEIRAIAQEVVNRAKGTAHVDTGALKRSISYTYVRDVVIFRELFYGQFGDNSELEKIARKLIPNGVAWKIIYTNFGGDTYEVGKTRQGRATQSKVISAVKRTATNRIKALISLAQKKRKDGEATD